MKYEVNQNSLQKLKSAQECFYANEKKTAISEWMARLPVTGDQIRDAALRLDRFAKLIEVDFPETRESHGIIESPLIRIPQMQDALGRTFGFENQGTLYLKKDSHLAVAGSVKARGGIYEVLKYTEDLLIRECNWDCHTDYALLADKKYKNFLSDFTIQVGSTGNLGMSIGIISAKLGYKVIVHMSSDAKDWKKALLRENGVTVIEYADDYSQAVENGRKNSDKDPKSYFVDDENSINLFLGYAVAAFRLKKQLEEMKISVTERNPLVLYIPCGVGGAPGGITYGCKYVFGANVYAYFVEPTQACCMTLGMLTGKHNEIGVKDIGLTAKTSADGLAVGRPSRLVGRLMEPVLDGLFTATDESLSQYEKMLYEQESVFIEPSACAGFTGYRNLLNRTVTGDYPEKSGMDKIAPNATHIVWATGGSLVPEKEREKYLRDPL